jgi:[lysine-biosynthesis-protein LysW]--L-2-aminoadipate ligase
VATAASEAVGGGLLGVDLIEQGKGYVRHEVNSGVEFKTPNAAVPDAEVSGRTVAWPKRRVEGEGRTQA